MTEREEAFAPDGKATPPDEMGAEQPKAASEHHALSERTD